MTTEPDTVIPEGTMLAHYRIEHVLGAGGMGTVYRAHDTALDRPVAVKVLRDKYADDPEVVDRFVREARAAARVVHPNLAHIYFVGEIGGHRFFTMEFVPGTSLEAYVKEDGPLPLGEAVDLLVQAAQGLGATHGVGVVHRDVKPANLIRRPDGVLKVADFGLSKSIGGDVNSTGVGSIVGTPTFMSPEQCRGDDVDARTDVYALGLVAFYLLSGRPAFEGAAVGKVLDAQMNHPLPSLHEERPELSSAVDAVLARLCAKNPDERPDSMDEVIDELERLRPRDVVPAPVLTRALAFAIDSASIGVVTLASFGLLYVLEDVGLSKPLLTLLWTTLFAGLVALAHLVFELARATTVGKWLLHLEVTTLDGTPAGKLALLLRFLLRYPCVLLPIAGVLALTIPALADDFVQVLVLSQTAAIAVGFGCALIRGRRTLSDRLTRTLVTTRIRD